MMRLSRQIGHTVTMLVVVIMTTAGFALNTSAVACECEYALYAHQENSGVSGNTLSLNTWNTRTINATVAESGNSISLDPISDEITLQPGTYYIDANVARVGGQYSKLRLRTTSPTPATTLAVGLSSYHFANIQLQTYVVITSATTFHVEHYIRTQGADPLKEGLPTGGGEPEVYLTIHIMKITDVCH